MGERGGRPPEQVVGRGQVASGQGAAARRSQVRRRTPAERLDVGVGHAQLGADVIRLLQVVAADLLVLEDAIARRLLDPVDEPHVELGTRPFQESSVGGVADQRVEEPERLLTDQRLLVRADELLHHEGLERVSYLRLHRRRHQRLDGSAVEDLPDHGAPFDHRSLRRSEAIETRRQQRRDRRRDLQVRKRLRGDPPSALVADGALVDQHLQHLLQVQRIAVGRDGHAIDDLGVQVGDAEQVLHHPGALFRRQRFEGQRAEAPVVPAPLGMLLDQLPPR